MERTQSEREAARVAKHAAESRHYAAVIARQRERYSAAYGRTHDMEAREAARAMFVAAAIFERDANRIPSRAKKAIDALKLAVFMLDPKAPA
ncbi:hypothetical protein EOS_31550 [Caballeronia mineralivorans PML1(12)]|uniref:Uncharacterized protein n=1 Tax=Caballeronia mineralivorans PML1(12) TaxID=908627 RepID=A0A0J1CNJ9_9BURK|nr:hypothetical protein EOS_31550 [Caballeronia mineralivorans PML1(12)]